MFTSFVGIYRYDLMTLHVDQMITDNYFTFYVLDEKKLPINPFFVCSNWMMIWSNFHREYCLALLRQVQTDWKCQHGFEVFSYHSLTFCYFSQKSICRNTGSSDDNKKYVHFSATQIKKLWKHTFKELQ